MILPHRLRPLAILAAADGGAILLAVALAVLGRYWLNPELPVQAYLRLVPFTAIFIGLYAMARLYATVPPGPSNELKRLTQSTTLGFIALAAFTFMTRGAEVYSRAAFLAAWLLALALVPLGRAVVRSWFARRPWWGSPVVVLGAGLTAEILLRQLARHPWQGLQPVAVFDDDPAKQGKDLGGVPVVGPLDGVTAFARARGIRHAIVAMPGAPQERLAQLWRDLGPEFPHVIVIPGLVGFASLWVEAKDLSGVLALEVRQSLLLRWPKTVKRALDLVFCVLAALPLGLLLLLLAVLVKLDSRGPLFYSQRRMGRERVPFQAWKFRTMRDDADAVLAEMLAKDPALRTEWERDHKLRDDPRITRVGAFLRKTSLDELPQAWNVLVGEMSWVGPRPVTEPELDRYGDHAHLYERVRPGLTGLWQVSGRNHTTYEERVAYDAYYVRNWSVWLDVFLIAKTIRVVLRGEGAY